MSRFLSIFFTFWVFVGAVQAQEFSGLARIDPAQTSITEARRGAVRIDLALSQGVPYRVFTLADPARLVLDFQEVDWTGLDPVPLEAPEQIKQVRFGAYVPGWSRMVLELAGPMAVNRAAMQIDTVTGRAGLGVTLTPTTADAFTAKAGAPHDPRWDLPEPALTKRPLARGEDAPLVVMLDPGHGGIDPGAQQDGLSEKQMMLTFARELRETLLRTGGYEVMLTRDSDHFVSLEGRVARAHQAGADVFISLHADSLSEGLAHGATVYALSVEASDAASAKLSERHDRGDLLSGTDLKGADDEVTDILLHLARQETRPRTMALARALVTGMTNVGGPMNRRPLRMASFSVLKAADIPSVLVEIGFLSSPRDLKNLRNAEWRAGMAQGIRNGIEKWREEDAKAKALVRQ